MQNETRTDRSRALRVRRHRQIVWTLGAVAAVLVVVGAALLLWGGGSTRLSDASRTTSTTATTVTQTSSTTVAPLTTAPPVTSTPPTTKPASSTTTSSTTTTSTTSTTATLSAAPIVRTGPTNRKWIALTFDDNYQLDTAYGTLAVLKKYKVPATLFVIGHYVDLGPALAKQIAADGFEVGDHTRSHANCTTLSKHGLRIEIGNGTDHYHALTGAPTVPLFRPPGGFVDQKTCEVAAEKGFKYVVMWDVDTNDWRGRTAPQITETVMGNAHNGAIVLMHMAAKHTAEALPSIITRLRAAGYELVSLTTMLGL